MNYKYEKVFKQFCGCKILHRQADDKSLPIQVLIKACKKHKGAVEHEYKKVKQ
jgi:hypothetical protein